MDAMTDKVLELSKREIKIERTLDAPRELVWQAWTDPDHLSQWWGPHGFTAPLCQWDARPGGAILVHMRGPQGSPFDFDMPMGGRFEEVHAPERLVFVTTAMPDEDGRPQLEVRLTVTFTEEHGSTRITVQAVVLRSTPGTDSAIAGMEQGWTESLEKLADHLRAA